MPFAADATAGLDPLRSLAAIPDGRTGSLGVSQGGWIAPLAATLDPTVAFVVNLSGAATTPNRQLAHEIKQDMRRMPCPVLALGVALAKARRPRWWWKNGSFDPLPYWCRLQRPSLTVLGRDDERDNVPVQRSLERLDGVRAITAEMEVRVYDVVGHGLADPATGRLHKGFLFGLVDWIHSAASSATVRDPDRQAACREFLGN